MIISMGGSEKSVPDKLGLALIKMGKAFEVKQDSDAVVEPEKQDKAPKKKAQKSAVIEDSSDE